MLKKLLKVRRIKIISTQNTSFRLAENKVINRFATNKKLYIIYIVWSSLKSYVTIDFEDDGEKYRIDSAKYR